jgi:glycosidase
MQDAALRDNDPWPTVYAGMPRLQTPNRTLNTEDCFALAGDLRSVCDEFGPDRVLLGEVFGPSPVLRRYVSDGDRAGLHLVFLFDFLAARYGASVYRALIARFERDFPPPMAPTWVLENHDRARSLSRVGGDLRKARLLATLLCTLRGVAVIYQGQEIGMENRYIPLGRREGPRGRHGREAPARVAQPTSARAAQPRRGPEPDAMDRSPQRGLLPRGRHALAAGARQPRAAQRRVRGARP